MVCFATQNNQIGPNHILVQNLTKSKVGILPIYLVHPPMRRLVPGWATTWPPVLLLRLREILR